MTATQTVSFETVFSTNHRPRAAVWLEMEMEDMDFSTPQQSGLPFVAINDLLGASGGGHWYDKEKQGKEKIHRGQQGR